MPPYIEIPTLSPSRSSAQEIYVCTMQRFFDWIVLFMPPVRGIFRPHQTWTFDFSTQEEKGFISE